MLSLDEQQTCYLMIFFPFPFKCLTSLLSKNKTIKRKEAKSSLVLLLPAGKPRLYLRSHEAYSVLTPAGISALKTLLLILMPSSSCSYEPRAPPPSPPGADTLSEQGEVLGHLCAARGHRGFEAGHPQGSSGSPTEGTKSYVWHLAGLESHS